MKISVYDQHGKSTGTLDLEVEKITVTPALLHQAVVRAQGNARKPIAKTKKRGEVSGGGKKPWKQKGTGRARQGSIRSPQWRHGGIVFGPTGEENYATRMPKSARRAAIRMALKTVIEGERLAHVQALELAEPKTKTLVSALDKLPAKDKRRVLIVLAEPSVALERSARNLPHVKLLGAGFLNVPDLLRADCVLVVGNAIDSVSNALKA